MNISELKSVLRPWVIPQTWPSRHPCDNERFNRAIKSAFDLFGTTINYDDFVDAVTLLANEHHQDEISNGNDEFISEYAKRAEIIGSYLFDNLLLKG